ncbi:MAG: zinc ABC transporter solute-binding protein [Cellvibrionales bacterium]|nr:zinc ABC transporter solute-binding protein [Cellvibrionales bacterium]MDA7737186.1 zinc ABC transporter substrate-binding protein [Porticoccus sp.]
MLRSCLIIIISFIINPVFASQNSSIASSIRPIAMLLTAVTGDETSVNILLPGNMSPHNYRLRFSDIKLIKESDLFFWIGPNLESGISKAVKTHGTTNIIKLMDIDDLSWPKTTGELGHSHSNLNHGHDNEHESYEGVKDNRDHHIWLSPQNAVAIVATINDLLGKKFPDKKEFFEKNTNNFEASLKSLNITIRERLEEIKHKGFLVAHDGYRHFVDFYDLNQLGIVDLTDDISPSAKHKGNLNKLIDKTSCIFTDPQHTSKVANQLAKKFNIKSRELDLMGHNIPLGKNSYIDFLSKLSETVVECLK